MMVNNLKMQHWIKKQAFNTPKPQPNKHNILIYDCLTVVKLLSYHSEKGA